jgi:GTPase SAR1 family protein
MGVPLTVEKCKLFNWYKSTDLDQIEKKFRFIDERRIILVGPPQSGKTQLLNKLSDNPFCETYKSDENPTLAFKIFSTVKSKHKHIYPISF